MIWVVWFLRSSQINSIVCIVLNLVDSFKQKTVNLFQDKTPDEKSGQAVRIIHFFHELFLRSKLFGLKLNIQKSTHLLNYFTNQ
jgi:hypothetical protein